MMRIAILGVGAMGSLFGARLALAGEDVVLIDIDPVHIGAIQAHGLRLEADDGDRRVKVPAGRASDFTDPIDLLILFTKARHSAAALRDAGHLLGPQSWILTLQNGLGAGERAAAAAPGRQVAIGMTDWPADLKGPGHVASHGSGLIRFWSFDGADHQMLGRIDAVLQSAGLSSRVDPDVAVAIWEKVIFNAALNPVAALTRLTVGGMAVSRDGSVLTDTVLAEAFAVARAADIAVNESRVRAAVAHAYREHGPHQPSMLKDLLAGRATEIDVINGALLDLGQAHGLPMPVNETLLRLVQMAQTA